MSSNNTSATPAKTFACVVTFDKEITWVEVQGKERAFRLHLPNKATWDATSNEELRLIRKLTDDPNADSEMQLTAAEMRLFADCCRRLNPTNSYTPNGKAKVGENPAPVTVAPVAVPTPVVAPVAPVAQINKPNVSSPTAKDVQERTMERVSQRMASHNQTVSHRGIDILENRARSQSRFLELVKGGLCQLDYDIHGMKVQNPSWMLWRYGFRMSESIWCVFASLLEREEIKDMFSSWDANGVTYHITRFHPDEVEKLRKRGQEALDRTLTDIHTSLITRIATADATLQEALNKLATEDGGINNTYNNRDKVAKARFNNVRSILRESAEKLDAAIRCAENFDLDGCTETLIEGYRDAIRAQVQAFNAAARMEGYKTSTVQV